MSEEQLTDAEKAELQKYFGSPHGEEKHSVHTFLNKVAISDDTTKTGNLTAEEVGVPKLTLRTYKELALISDKIIGSDDFKEYYEKKGEILTSTSLSKDAVLIKLAVVQRRELSDVTPIRKENKGWFKKKQKPEDFARVS